MNGMMKEKCKCKKLKEAKEKLDAAQKEYDLLKEDSDRSIPDFNQGYYVLPIYINKPPWHPPWTITTRNNTSSTDKCSITI